VNCRLRIKSKVFGLRPNDLVYRRARARIAVMHSGWTALAHPLDVAAILHRVQASVHLDHALIPRLFGGVSLAALDDAVDTTG
jgi:hypothetical protein